MKHTSVKLDTPCEFVNITPINPLISKCQIKVCYVGDTPNRNGSVITKDVAREMANSLPGSPIVGYYNENTEDFEEHNRIIEISNGKVKVKDTTKPYGFVDLNAKVWFQKFLDDGVNTHEYLMTEGYIWTGAYPESKRIIEKGNNQSMELSEEYLDATWTKDDNGKQQFFIINEALISKLCVLGEDCEPCFEGSTITKFNLSLDEDFKQQVFSMINEVKELIKEGGTKKVYTKYAVEIGGELWDSIYNYLQHSYPDPDDDYISVYAIEGIFEESEQKFIVLRHRSSKKYYRMNFSITEKEGFIPSDTLIEVTKSYTPAEEPQFALADVEAYEAEYASKKVENEGKDDKNNSQKTENNTEDSNAKSSTNTEPDQKPEENPEPDNKVEYNLEEIPEYIALRDSNTELQTKFNKLEQDFNALEEEIKPLRQFKLDCEKKEKEDMINKFYMLSDEDKADVVNNIDKYSVDDIEAKLSVICVRNRVSFDLDEGKDDKKDPTVYNLDGATDDDTNAPAWVKAAIAVSENKN